jgi:hypothetical protein
MDRGVPTEAVLAEMRASEPPVHCLVGTPRGRLGQLEQGFLSKSWTDVRDTVQVKLVQQDGELYVLARSGARRDKACPSEGRGTGDAAATAEEAGDAAA